MSGVPVDGRQLPAVAVRGEPLLELPPPLFQDLALLLPVVSALTSSVAASTFAVAAAYVVMMLLDGPQQLRRPDEAGGQRLAVAVAEHPGGDGAVGDVAHAGEPPTSPH